MPLQALLPPKSKRHWVDSSLIWTTSTLLISTL